jgi:hypothetical protein
MPLGVRADDGGRGGGASRKISSSFSGDVENFLQTISPALMRWGKQAQAVDPHTRPIPMSALEDATTPPSTVEDDSQASAPSSGSGGDAPAGASAAGSAGAVTNASSARRGQHRRSPAGTNASAMATLLRKLPSISEIVAQVLECRDAQTVTRPLARNAASNCMRRAPARATHMACGR